MSVFFRVLQSPTLDIEKETVEMEAQVFETVERRGFTAVEWGGSETNRRG